MTVNIVPRERNIITCDQCGKTFSRTPSDMKGNDHNFCSRKCYIKWKKENSESKKQVCDHPDCKNEVVVKPYQQKKYDYHFCSKNCMEDFMSNHRGDLDD